VEPARADCDEEALAFIICGYGSHSLWVTPRIQPVTPRIHLRLHLAHCKRNCRVSLGALDFSLVFPPSLCIWKDSSYQGMPQRHAFLAERALFVLSSRIRRLRLSFAADRPSGH
jgi:hypothetical protein